jgi:hypothetical protein
MKPEKRLADLEINGSFEFDLILGVKILHNIHGLKKQRSYLARMTGS